MNHHHLFFFYIISMWEVHTNMPTICPLCRKSQTRMKRHVESIHKTTLNAMREFAKIPFVPRSMAKKKDTNETLTKDTKDRTITIVECGEVFEAFLPWLLKEKGKKNKNAQRYRRCVEGVLSKTGNLISLKRLEESWWNRTPPNKLREQVCSMYIFIDFLLETKRVSATVSLLLKNKLAIWSKSLRIH